MILWVHWLGMGVIIHFTFWGDFPLIFLHSIRIIIFESEYQLFYSPLEFTMYLEFQIPCLH